MKLVSQGVSRHEAHEEIRVSSHQASDVVKKMGSPMIQFQRIKSTTFFKPVWGEIDGMMDPKNLTSRCPEQVVGYCDDETGEVKQAFLPYKKHIERAKAIELKVYGIGLDDFLNLVHS